MFPKIILWLTRAVWKDGASRLIFFGPIFFILSLPVLAIGLYHVISVDKKLDGIATEQRQLLAVSAAALLGEKLDTVAGFINAFANHPKIRELVSEKKWDEALDYVKFFRLSDDQSYIDGIFFVDLDGNLTTITPPSPEALGRSFAFRDWYKGALSSGRLYLSEVYRRVQKPEYNIVAMVSPIIGEDGLPIGIVGFQIKIDHFAEWSSDIATGSLGSVSVVDQRGHVVSDPRHPSQGLIIDFSEIAAVKKVRNKETGAEISFNPYENEKQVIAYAPVIGYGWGVLIKQNASNALADTINSRLIHLTGLGLLLLWVFFLIYLILRTIEYFKSGCDNIPK